MTREAIQTAQDYLTIGTKDNGKRKIIDLDQLLRRHSFNEVVDLLKTMIKEKQQSLRDLILEDKTRPEIDEMVSVLFRITMAIKTIEAEREVKESGGTK